MTKSLIILLLSLLEIIPSGKAFLEPVEKRDSILIADQVEYGFRLDALEKGTVLALPDYSKASNDTLTLVRGWKLDTLSRKKDELVSIKASVLLAPFEEGTYHLPEIYVLRGNGEVPDTLMFESLDMEVKSMPVDTATFVIHDIKGQMTYPVTFAEVAPWIGGALVLAALIFFLVKLILKRRREAAGVERKDPAHIVALRELDKYRSDRFWAPERQKTFYSGVTDALKNYIDGRFGVDAPEMTTAELFAALKGESDITPELYFEMKELFERADFVKFAKFVVDDTDNAKVLPSAVRFVTSTYQAEVENETQGGEAPEK